MNAGPWEFHTGGGNLPFGRYRSIKRNARPARRMHSGYMTAVRRGPVVAGGCSSGWEISMSERGWYLIL